MIAFLKGQVLHVDVNSLTVLVGGVGYELECTSDTVSRVEIGQTCDFYVFTHVREDALQLFGFLSLVEKHLFLSLIKVNGIGPKSALQMIGAGGVEAISKLINSGDAKGLSQLPKVGKKTAEQIILTLKGKLTFVESGKSKNVDLSQKPSITSALVHLGFKLSDIEKVVSEMPMEIDLETGVREGLAALTN
jgi:holliday junction DNA helicase RuvA